MVICLLPFRGQNTSNVRLPRLSVIYYLYFSFNTAYQISRFIVPLLYPPYFDHDLVFNIEICNLFHWKFVFGLPRLSHLGFRRPLSCKGRLLRRGRVEIPTSLCHLLFYLPQPLAYWFSQRPVRGTVRFDARDVPGSQNTVPGTGFLLVLYLLPMNVSTHALKESI